MRWCGANPHPQANTARRAERTLAEQAQEQHANELAQQKEHEQMVAQIGHTERCGHAHFGSHRIGVFTLAW